MFTASTLRSQSILGRAALLVLALLMGSGAVASGNPDATMTIASDPNPNAVPAQWATVSRDVTSTVGPADFYISYKVSITNPTNSSKNYRFVGHVTVAGIGAIAPTQFVSSRPDCTLTASSNPVQITCPRLEVAKGRTVTFNVAFRTPTGGTTMQMDAQLFFPADKSKVAATAQSKIDLKEQLDSDYRLGFYTFVPTTGGTFCTGDNGNGGSNNPGCVAKSVDPITTTIVIPSGSIPTSTTARVQESQIAVCTSGNFTACYNTSLTIPNVTFNPPLQIILRIDNSQLFLPTNLNGIKIFYENYPDPVPQCSGNLPQPNQPCWTQRGFYPPDFRPADFAFDFFVVILARDNGTFRLR